MICFRVDANKNIGIGHIMRCLSIAEAMRKLGTLPFFIVADREATDLIENKGFSYICLDTDYTDMESEIPIVEELIDENKIEKIIVDSYYVSQHYVGCIKKRSKVIYIDDLHLGEYYADCVINYNVYAEELGYKDGLLLLGPQYAPLREEFKNVKKIINRKVKNILITTGGSDQYNVIGAILDKLVNSNLFAEYNFNCIIGKFNINEEALNNVYGNYKNIRLIRNIDNMSLTIQESDLCITAGGSTLYELCACGTPSILYTIADNQFDAAKEFSKMGIIPYIGDFREDKDNCLESLMKELKRLLDYGYRKKISLNMKKIVDGLGAERISEVLLKM